jgi:hypothetical protein
MVAHKRFCLIFGLVACASVVLCSCGRSNRLPVYPVKGTVLVDGKPVKGVHLSFWPENGAADVGAYSPQAETDENGAFVLSTYDAGDGAPAGKYFVTARLPERYNIVSNQWEGNKLKPMYNDPKSSKLSFQIEPQPNELPPIKLESKG